jgi:hypothetical protein
MRSCLNSLSILSAPDHRDGVAQRKPLFKVNKALVGRVSVKIKDNYNIFKGRNEKLLQTKKPKNEKFFF